MKFPKESWDPRQERSRRDAEATQEAILRQDRTAIVDVEWQHGVSLTDAHDRMCVPVRLFELPGRPLLIPSMAFPEFDEWLRPFTDHPISPMAHFPDNESFGHQLASGSAGEGGYQHYADQSLRHQLERKGPRCFRSARSHTPLHASQAHMTHTTYSTHTNTHNKQNAQHTKLIHHKHPHTHTD